VADLHTLAEFRLPDHAWTTAEEVAAAPGAVLSPDGGVEDLLLLPALEISPR
jgi:hypothetical protein